MALSRLAERMFSLTLILFVLARFASPSLAGWMTFAALAPGLILSPVAGAILDRTGPATAVRIDVLCSAFFVALLAATSAMKETTVAVLFLLVLLFSLTRPLGGAGVRSLLPRLVPPAALDRANAVDTAIWATVDTLGPAVAGVSSSWLGPEPTMLLIAVMYAAATLCIWKLPHLQDMGPARTSLLRQTFEGLVFVLRDRTLYSLAFAYSFYQFSWGALVVVVPVFATEHFSQHTAGSVAGFLWAATGVAGGLGALVAGHVRTRGREVHLMAFGMMIAAFAAWPLAGEFGLAGVVIGLMLAGIMSGPIDVAVLTLRQRRTDPRQFGRVLSISMSLNVAGFPIGSAIAGMLVAHSLSLTFGVAAMAATVGALATIAIPRDPSLPSRSVEVRH